MSSDAAAYFPEALSKASRIRDSGHCVEERPAGSSGSTQSDWDSVARVGAAIIPIAEVSDESLLEEVREGDKDALGVLFRRHARTVRNVAYRILRDDAEADDLVQDVFIYLFRKAEVFDAQQGGAVSWIIQITYHRAFDRRRYLNTRHFYTSRELDDPAVPLVDRRTEIPFYERSMEGILGKELTARFNTKLSAEQRETVELHFFEGYTLREISEMTGRPLANVRRYYYRGLERLRKYVLHEKLRTK